MVKGFLGNGSERIKNATQQLQINGLMVHYVNLTELSDKRREAFIQVSTEIKSLQLKRLIQIGFISVLHKCLMFRIANPVRYSDWVR